MLQNLSSAAVMIGALRVYPANIFCPNMVVSIIHLHIQTYFMMEAQTKNPDQIAPKGEV